MPQSSQAIDYANKPLTELAVMVQQGHREAFRHIMQRCNQRLFRVARAVLNDDSEAEDALQDAYINAYQHMDAFRGEAELSTWLTRIVLNECNRRIRSRHSTVDIDQIDTAQAGSRVLAFFTRYGMDDPAQSASRSQIRELIENAVSKLPDAFRTVFVLRDIEGCSIEETAALLDIRAGTVKTRLFRARRQMRKALREKVSSSLGETFPFLGVRCARLTDAVMQRLIDGPDHDIGESRDERSRQSDTDSPRRHE